MRGADALGAPLIPVLDEWATGAGPAPRSPYDGRGAERSSAGRGRWLSPRDPSNPPVGDDCCVGGRLLLRCASLGRGNERSAGPPLIALFDPGFPGNPGVGLLGWDECETEFEFDCGGRGT